MNILNTLLHETLLYCQIIFGKEAGIIIASFLTVGYMFAILVISFGILKILKNLYLNVFKK